MKTFNHKQIHKNICEKFNLKTWQKGKFDYFYNEDGNGCKAEIGFIEKISGGNYLYTFLISFFDFETPSRNDEIVNFIQNQYQDQKTEIDKNKEGFNVCLELRGTEICKAKLI